MSKNNLVIVESPAKAKTLEKFLGADYQVKSSFGHIRDLPKKKMNVDIDNNFEPSYEISPDKKKTVAELKKFAKIAETVWLASDEDREGEAISWHLSEALKLDPKKIKRIVFHEITKPAILEAIKKPRGIDYNLVDAQQARRILDRIVGYELSPVLWKKVRPGLSAGRVQSVAVRLIVEREREIEAFTPDVTFKVTAVFTLKDSTELPAELNSRLKTEDQAADLLNHIKGRSFSVDGIEKSPATRNPSAPFTTSTLQQEASRRLGYSPKQTMMLAQRLYEVGHITYMRTDSFNLSPIAINAMGTYIKDQFGADYHTLRTFITKTAGAQEAHEAIRPTEVKVNIAGNDEQQSKLYQLIWRRALASQMSTARLEKTTIVINIEGRAERFEAKGEVVQFPGFLKVYEDSKKDTPLLPPVAKGDPTQLQTATAIQTFSRGPARYSEATLVRQLEEMGIGRPSTYAPTISTVQDRGYVMRSDVEGKIRKVISLKLKGNLVERAEDIPPAPIDRSKLIPTDTGNVVTDFLVKHFSDIVDYDFTKDVEAEFDEIATGKKNWRKMLKGFYGPFHQTVGSSADITRMEATKGRILGTDPKTKKPISARFGRFGPMVQLGEAEDDEKPTFATIPSGSKVETITLEEALKLLQLPRMVGKDKNGNQIEANFGRFGPYLKVNGKFISIKEHDPHTIDLSTSLRSITEHETKQAERYIKEFEGSKIALMQGRFGPYISDGKKNAKIPKDTEPKSLTLKQATEILAAAPVRKGGFRRSKKAKT